MSGSDQFYAPRNHLVCTTGAGSEWGRGGSEGTIEGVVFNLVHRVIFFFCGGGGGEGGGGANINKQILGPLVEICLLLCLTFFVLMVLFSF